MDSSFVEPLGADDPRRIGRFPIIGLLGAGAMGKVYLGVGKDGYVAVKRVRSREVSHERFEQEVAVLHKVPLGVAPRVLAHDSTVDHPWFATEYVPGVTLHEAVRLHGPLPADALRLLLSEIVSQLYEVHGKAKVVHRDLKPANLMLVRNGVTLIDFGIARAADLPRLTQLGEGFGTRGFAAPEQEKGGATADSPADIYSLGAVLLYAASGSDPDENPDSAPLREKDPELAAIVERCLAVSPSERPTTAELVAVARELVEDPDVSWPEVITEQIEARRALERTPVEDILAGLAAARPEQKNGTLEDELAKQVKRQWEREEQVRRVHDPYPLPVRFDAAERSLFDHWANIHGTGPDADPGPIALAGDIGEITAIYRSIPSRRLVVLGQPGSGKTVLAVRFVLDRFRERAPDERVPVIFGLSSWDPAAVSLRDWMCRQLERDYRTLGGSGADGRTKAADLIYEHRILPVLDGFDEIAEDLRAPALTALSRYDGPLLLTSRPDEYAEARKTHTVLTAAACIELEPLNLDDVDRYLTRASPLISSQAAYTVWEPVLRELRAQPKSAGAANVTDALATPLMLALARTVYSDVPGSDPTELLRTGLYPDAASIQEHLLAEFVPTSYRRLPADIGIDKGSRAQRERRWNGERAEQWLAYLAWHMRRQERHNLAWWELGTAMGRGSMMLVVGAAVAVAAGVLAGLIYGSAAAISQGPAIGLTTAIGAAIGNGLAIGLTFGLMHGFASALKAGGPVFEPSQMDIRLHRAGWKKVGVSLAPRVGAGLVGGLLFGVLWATGSGLFTAAVSDTPRVTLIAAAYNELALGTGLGLATGLVAALGTGLEAVSDQATATRPTALLATNRINVLLQLTAVGVLIGVGYGAVLGPAPGLAAGLMVPLGLGTMTAWGRWVVLVRIWLPLRGRAPWAMIAFLEDAYERGVLRQAGAVYQLRHDRIQTQLADRFVSARRADIPRKK